VWYYSAGQNDSPPYIFPRNSGNCLSLALKLGPIDGRSALISPIKIEWNPRDIEKLSIQARGKRPGQKDSTLFKLGFSIDNYVHHIKSVRDRFTVRLQHFNAPLLHGEHQLLELTDGHLLPLFLDLVNEGLISQILALSAVNLAR
jgi:hypothetical protein